MRFWPQVALKARVCGENFVAHEKGRTFDDVLHTMFFKGKYCFLSTSGCNGNLNPESEQPKLTFPSNRKINFNEWVSLFDLQMFTSRAGQAGGGSFKEKKL